MSTRNCTFAREQRPPDMAPACSASGARRLMLPLLFLAFLSFTTAMPAPPPPGTHLSHLSRLQRADYNDIPASYASIYQIGTSCPDAVTFGENVVDERQVALLPMSSIQEDGLLCSGSSDMSLVSQATIEQEGLLTGLGLSGFRAALDANTNANSLIAVSDTDMIVGWHSATRTCGSNVYAPTTIYIIIKEAKAYTVSFKKGQQTDIVTIPAFLRSLLVISTDNKVCLLVDPSSSPGSDPTVTTDDGTGNTVTTVIIPAGSSPAPEGSTDAGPSASPNPGTSPSTGVGVTTPTIAPPSASPIPPSASAVPSPSADVSGGAPTDETDPMPTVEPVPSNGFDSDGGGLAPGVDGQVPTSDPETTTDIVTEPTQDDGSACFPGSAMVEVQDGTKRSMKELVVGDRVANGEGGFSDVIFFTHRERRSRNAFLRFTTVSGQKLTVSPGHYVYANGGSLRAAESLAIGEGLDLAEDLSSPISFAENVSAQGLYNPQTASGSLVVDGFKVSTYTTAVHPTLAHCVLMAPVRWLYALSAPLAATLAGAFDEGSPLLARLLPSGPGTLAVRH